MTVHYGFQRIWTVVKLYGIWNHMEIFVTDRNKLRDKSNVKICIYCIYLLLYFKSDAYRRIFEETINARNDECEF